MKRAARDHLHLHPRPAKSARLTDPAQVRLQELQGSGDAQGMLAMLRSEPKPFALLMDLARAGDSSVPGIFRLMEKELDPVEYDTFIAGILEADPEHPITQELLRHPTPENYQLLLDFEELNYNLGDITNVLEWLVIPDQVENSSCLPLLTALLQRLSARSLDLLFTWRGDMGLGYIRWLIEDSPITCKAYTEVVLSSICRFAPQLLVQARSEGCDIVSLLIERRFFTLILALPENLRPICYDRCLAACCDVTSHDVLSAIFSLPETGSMLYVRLMNTDEATTPLTFPLQNLLREVGTDLDGAADWMVRTRKAILRPLLCAEELTYSHGVSWTDEGFPTLLELVQDCSRYFSPTVFYPFLAKGQFNLVQLCVLRASPGMPSTLLYPPMGPDLTLGMFLQTKELLETVMETRPEAAQSDSGVHWLTDDDEGKGRFVAHDNPLP